ncbi:hypothetical protein OIT41_08700 [Arthrobacter sp. YA7-1]|uniref:hypothetical protein n=1 Tax=Arthrobacter sp. YA7-1 TaxID=2987701 RepID=UPI0022260088|nr:hypothetical protein [Arthrobacter sp. YA7-1]UYY83093.1 hypothetical protein OIT41_08700 [Arthrobacter sp. YA7-1]
MEGSSYAIQWVSGRVVLPAVGESWGFSRWGDDADRKIEQFIRQSVGRHAREDACVTVEVALIHRADNEYNPNAISVAMPARFGADPDSRHLGYLYDGQLRNVGMGRLPDLAEVAGGEIICKGMAYGTNGLNIDLPKPAELARAIDEFLGREGARQRHHTQPSVETDNALSALQSFAQPQESVEGLELTTRFGDMGRSLAVTDGGSRRLLGHVDRGYLFLVDERDRAVITQRLAGANVPVAKPIAKPAIPLADEWPITEVPNIQIAPHAEVFSFLARGVIAQYNPRTRKLWVEDSRLVGPALCFAARSGLEISEVGLPRRPWKLDDEFKFDELRDYGLRKQMQLDRETAVKPVIRELNKSVRVAGLKEVLPKEAIRSEAFRIMMGILTESEASLRLHEAHVEQRQRLFGAHRLMNTSDSCRLCRRRGATFISSVCLEPLTYCHQCLDLAGEGVFENRERAAGSLRMLGKLEFDDEPMLEGQLSTLHIDPKVPVSPRVVDKLLLLRFAIRRRRFPWTYLLEEAGLPKSGLRLSRGTLIRARDGHRCLSLGEKAVCDFLHQYGISHDREPAYPADADFNLSGRRRADWRLADGTFVELWGLPNDPAYAAKMLQKRQMAARHGLTLIELTDRDFEKLHLIFAPWLHATITGTTSWIWSPVLKDVVTASNDTAGIPRLENAFNAAARRDRLERCNRAVELRALGLNRRDIAERLGVSVDRLKVLLRDGRFYSNPMSDQKRLHRAGAATRARKRGLTKDEFHADSGLTSAKASEAWKDAEVVRPADNEF